MNDISDTLEQQNQNILLRPSLRQDATPLRPSQPIPRVSAVEPMVVVQVAGSRVSIPQHVLSEGLSHLRLSTGERVRLEDYAEALALGISALARRGIVSVPS